MKKQIFWIMLIVGLVSLFCATSLCGAKEKAVMSINPEPGHYFIFQLDGATIKLLHHKPVQMIGLVSKSEDEISALAEKSADTPNFVAHVLGAADEVLHQDFITVQKEVRAEFHSRSGSGIDGYSWDTEKPVFVVRIPAIQEAKKFRLQSHRRLQSGVVGQSLQQVLVAEPEINFELDLSDLVHKQAMEMSLSSEPAPDIMVLGGNGNSGNRVDILIMGDGYTQAERSKFFSDAQNLYQNFFSITPYKEYKNVVKVTALYTQSNQSGADHPPYDANCNKYDYSCCADSEAQYDQKATGAGTYVDTAFDSTFCGSPQIHRALVSNTTKVLAVAAVVPDWDSIMVIVNDDTYGGTGGYISTFSTDGWMVEVAQHEYGHSFTQLADEYDYGCSSGCSICQEPNCQPNVTSETQREKIKWNPLILPSTPIPTPNSSPINPFPYLYTVGLFEGAQYTTTGVYRPQYSCAMRSLGSPFCAVCTQEYILRLYRGGWGVPKDGIDLIEPGSENPIPGNVNANGSINFSVGLLQPIGGPALQVEWLVNDQAVQDTNSNSFVFVPSQTSSTIKLVVKDPTSLVNPLMAGDVLTSTRVWNVKTIVPETVSAPTMTGLTAGTVTKSYIFSASGSTDNLGYSVQYFFDWGDGTNSGWLPAGTSSACIKSWSSVGTYTVRVQARSAVNQAVVSEFTQLVITITLSKIFLNLNISGVAYNPGMTMTVDTPENLVVSATTEDGRSLVGTPLSLNGAGMSLSKMVDKTGKVIFSSFTSVDSGEILIKVEKVGYEPGQITIPVMPNQFYIDVSIKGKTGKQKSVVLSIKNLAIYQNKGQVKPVKGAQVTFTGSNIETTLTTSATGKISLTGKTSIVSGGISITITKRGYIDWVADVNIPFEDINQVFSLPRE